MPALPTSSSGYFLGTGGMNFYISSLSSKIEVNDSGTTITILPLWRFYWGFQVGMGYFVYLTSSAKKSDILLDTSIHVGMKYSLKNNWGLKAQLSMGKGTGLMTSTINTKVFIGGTYFPGK